MLYNVTFTRSEFRPTLNFATTAWNFDNFLPFWSLPMLPNSLPDLCHGPEGQVLLFVVDEPRRALGDVVQAEGEGHQEHAGGEAQPVPRQGPAHHVAAHYAQGCHHLLGAEEKSNFFQSWALSVFFNFFNYKKWFSCIFFQMNNLFLHQSYLKSPLTVKLTW